MTDKTQFDPELTDPIFNEIRKPSLPYGIVINGPPACEKAGILLPTDQLLKSQWLSNISETRSITVELTEQVTGVLLTQPRFCVLAAVPLYIRYKNIEDNGELAGTFIGVYNESKNGLNKKTMDVVSEHALVFLNSKNQPLHKIPIVVRLKNVCLWSFMSAKEEFYRNLEKAFAEYTEQPYSGKSDQWRSLGVLHLQFKPIKEGEGRNKSFCCKVEKVQQPTVTNLPKLFLGTPKQKQRIWKFHEEIAGFLEINGDRLPALASSEETTANKANKAIDPEVIDIDSIDIEEEEIDF